MKKLDKYLITQFFASLFVAVVFIVGLYVISICIDNLKYFSHPNVPLDIVLLFIINSLPEIFVHILPVAVLFAGSYVFGSLGAANEIIALYNGNISFKRLLLPVATMGMVLSISALVFLSLLPSTQAAGRLRLRIELRL